jgi:SMC interacting uncharacterized protein involved in chromosome segregation
MSGTPRKLTPAAAAPCGPKVKAVCVARIESLEQSVRELQQSNRELTEAVHAAIHESHRRSESLDRLARNILASDDGIKLLKSSSSSLTAIKDLVP